MKVYIKLTKSKREQGVPERHHKVRKYKERQSLLPYLFDCRNSEIRDYLHAVLIFKLFCWNMDVCSAYFICCNISPLMYILQ